MSRGRARSGRPCLINYHIRLEPTRDEEAAITDETTQSPPAPVIENEPVEIADGVYVIPDGGVPLVPNVGIVSGSRGTLVVDTGMGPRNGQVVRRHAERL